jgi:predicted outer membrane repeat protein
MKNANNKIQKIMLFTAILILTFISFSAVNAVNVTLNPSDAGGVNSAVSTVASGSDVDNTITLNPGTYNKTTDRNNNITFSGKNLTIQGNGSAGSVIIDAQKIGRLFSITGNSNITFINITFLNGNITGSGGGISKTGTGLLNVINCTFANNNVSANGGAIYNTAGELNIINSNFINNIARGATGGGAIYKSNSIFTINNSSFTNNTSPNGGAIACQNTIGSSITNSSFSNNTATGSGSGGAIFSQGDDELIINSSQFTNNNAAFGGACSINGELFSEVLNSVFINNSASGEGGAIEDNDNGYLTINNSTFINNTSPTGGAIFNYRLTDNTTISNSTFVNNNVSIVVRGKNTTITGCNFSNNTLAINITGNNTTIMSSNIFNNTQGIFVNSSAINTTINYNRIFNNTIATGFNLDNNGVNTNADLNWWGDNNPLVNGTTLGNYFVMNVTNATPLVSNGTVLFNYSFGLNTGGVANNSLLPFFVTNVYTNLTTGAIDTFDARFNRTVNVTLNTTNQSVEYIFITDNEIQRLVGFINASKIKTIIEVGNAEGENGETITLKARLTDINGNPLAGKELTFHIAGRNFTAITDSNGIARIQYTINQEDFTDGRLLFTVTFDGDETYLPSNGTVIITLIIEPPNPPTPPEPTPNNETSENLAAASAAMKKTGIPINLLMLLLVIFGIGYYKRKQ